MDASRDHGPQPLAANMAAKDLKPADLVSASTEQITHKMISRAMKGRQLTSKTMDKVVRAYNTAAKESAGHRELFNYLPAPLRKRSDPS